ncbi:antA/AntB antirepressor family protein [Acinetobacter sp. Ver3]|uniref:antA/AntB antirepressor family protein n=1 Tax=Acinetobacter sp. Ver3 TaxID=466088 RepID=UPI00044DFA54|nr:antA/AntB antirepressor family protein [Acinetobacter sp. Ver3]EZQ10732.1 antirepressor [Acinetobacter sp. Ver3]
MNAVINLEKNAPFVEVEIGGEVQLGVDARSLHKTLGSKQDFSTWIKRRISQCQFRENFDFISLHQKVERETGATSRVEYIITADMAKHLGLMEKTPQGHQIREYFIQQEKVARNTMYGIQLEINKAMLQLDHVKDVLSNAGRTLCVMGKQVKPQLMQNLDDLIAKAQPQLPFNAGE